MNPLLNQLQPYPFARLREAMQGIDAPAGVKGISLFIVPKFLVNEDGSLGARNGVRCARIEVIDRDGIKTKPGVYWLTQEARRVIRQWFARNQKGAL